MRLAGHCQRHQELPASKLVLWEPTLGTGQEDAPHKHMWTYSRWTQEFKAPASWPDVWRTGTTGSNDGRLV